MPGITGIWTQTKREGLPASLQKMVRAMEHEPFYGSQVYLNDPLGIGIGRVSHRGSFDDAPPVWNETRDVCLVFSGELFSDPGPLEDLRARGHRWDETPVGHLVHLYEEDGPDFVRGLNGRFCGVVVDLRDPAVILFNDRYGLHRVYWHQNSDGFFFSSEAKSLLAAAPELRRLDSRGLAETFSCGCALQNRTLFSGVSLLPGGTLWRFRPQGPPERGSYFSPKSWEGQDLLDGPGYYHELKETWPRILPRYLRGPGGIAMSLTGGKDSQMIMAWAKVPPGGLPCYTFGGMIRDSRDVTLGRRIAAACGQPHRVITLGRDFLRDFPDLAARTVALTDGAMDVSGAAELYVNRIARDIAPVRLTGNYGQEVLHRAVAFKPFGFNASLLDGEFAALVRDAEATYRRERDGHPLSFVAFKQVPWHHTSRLALELSQVILRSPYLDNDLVALSYRQPPNGSAESGTIQLRLIAEGRPELTGIGTDRALAHRPAPLLGGFKRLWQTFLFKSEYAYDYGMPPFLVLADGVLRRVHVERLFLGRHKFCHFRIWYRDELSPYVKEILLDPRTLRRPYLNGRAVEKVVVDHSRGRANHTSDIHRLLTAELTERLFID